MHHRACCFRSEFELEQRVPGLLNRIIAPTRSRIGLVNGSRQVLGCLDVETGAIAEGPEVGESGLGVRASIVESTGAKQT
jgi:hypothetical protein